MNRGDDNIVSLDAHRRQRKKEEKRPPKPRRQWNVGYVLLGALLIVVLAVNFMKMQRKAGDFTLHVVGDTAYGNGSTDGNSVNYVLDVLNENPQISRLVLQTMPGTSDGKTNLRLAETLRRRGISTHLENRSIIASGAVDLFIAGETRTMECGAKIGVHSWRTAPGKSPETLGKDQFAPDHESFLRKMGVDPAFYVFTREAAPPHDIHFMSMEEIKTYGLLSQDISCP